MRKLTIDGVPLIIWMETPQDAIEVTKCYPDDFLYLDNWQGGRIPQALLDCPRMLLISGPMAITEELLLLGQKVMYCVETSLADDRTFVSPKTPNIKGWQAKYRGQVAYGGSPAMKGVRTVSLIPEWHVRWFEAFGYS